jgi:signal transduction histidine kinase
LTTRYNPKVFEYRRPLDARQGSLPSAARDLWNERSKETATGWISQSAALASHFRNLVVFEIAFFFAYRYGMAFPAEFPAPFWFPDAVLLCALLTAPRKTWWMYLLAPLPIRLFVFVPAGMPAWFPIACLINDSAKALLAAWLLRRDSNPRLWFQSLQGFARYFWIAVVIIPAFSAFAGAASHVAARDAEFWSSWRPWFFGDAMANLVLTPAAFSFLRALRNFDRAAYIRYAELILMAAGLTFTGYLAFHRGLDGIGYPPFLLYLPVPFLLWAAIRFGPLATSGALSLISVLAVVGTLAGRGPFSIGSAASRIVEIQLFLFVLSLPFLVLSVLVRDRQEAEKNLRLLHGKLIGIQEKERQRIGQELHDDLGQRVVALSLGLSGLTQQVKLEEGPAAVCADLQLQVRNLCKDIALLSRQFRPHALDTFGLAAALKSLCKQSTAPGGPAIEFTQHGELPAIPREVSISLFRVAQEALRNALTHSGADHLIIDVSGSHKVVHLTISDKGCGFVVGSATVPGLGLSVMVERMRNAGGKLKITSTPGSGTTVRASVPLLRQDEKRAAV